jgi:hypothetical protein
MAEKCLQKPGSNPPVCGVHNVTLVEKTAKEYGGFKFLSCPVSSQVIDDAAPRKREANRAA